jgi:hypothetical protein
MILENPLKVAASSIILLASLQVVLPRASAEEPCRVILTGDIHTVIW